MQEFKRAPRRQTAARPDQPHGAGGRARRREYLRNLPGPPADRDSPKGGWQAQAHAAPGSG
eukprot:6208237-Lingulodinium_polyedra.AAC.1